MLSILHIIFTCLSVNFSTTYLLMVMFKYAPLISIVVTSLPLNVFIMVKRIKISECTIADANSILDLYTLYCIPLAAVLPLIVLSHFSFISDNAYNTHFFYLNTSHLALMR